jgi:hypothetical protein
MLGYPQCTAVRAAWHGFGTGGATESERCARHAFRNDAVGIRKQLGAAEGSLFS